MQIILFVEKTAKSQKLKPVKISCYMIFQSLYVICNVFDALSKDLDLVDNLLLCNVFAEETASAQSGALYKPMAKLSATVMEQKIKTELAPPKLVCA